MTEKRLFRHAINPCDYDRYRGLTAFGDGVAKFWNLFTAGTECPCCLGFRLFGALLAAGGIGYGLALL